MKVAILHDWLNAKQGGAERVLAELASLYPEAPIYTLLYDRERYGQQYPPNRVKPSLLQLFPGFLRRRPRYLWPLIPVAIKRFDLRDYDLVIAYSSGYVKNVRVGSQTKLVCYCNSPLRAVWDYWPRYVAEQQVGRLRKAAIHLIASRMRVWDFYGSQQYDRFAAISKTVANRITKFYRRPAKVIYPPVDAAELSNYKTSQPKGDYYVTLAVLTPYKKIDLAIEACNQSGRRLTVIGDGADRQRLEKLAGPTITFAGRVSESDKRELVANARGLIFPNEEDFGIAPVEALALGTPVIAFNQGGATETITPDCGVFFDTQTPAALQQALDQFEKRQFESAKLRRRALEFDVSRWRKDFQSYVEQEIQGSHV